MAVTEVASPISARLCPRSSRTMVFDSSGYVRWGHSDSFLFAQSAHCPRYTSYIALEWSEGSIPVGFTGGITSSAATPN